jgi:hypothetical protein
MEKPFLESGIRIDNIFRYNYMNIAWLGVGGAVFYRWGYQHHPNELKNFIPKLSLKFTL